MRDGEGGQRENVREKEGDIYGGREREEGISTHRF